MTPEAILADLFECGIEPGLTPDQTGIVVPAGKLTEAQRTAVLSHKPELIACILESARVTSQLLQAALRSCDHHTDGPAAREQMRRECLEVPPHLRTDLLEHFVSNYQRKNVDR